MNFDTIKGVIVSLTPLITALAALVGAVAQGIKIRAEIRSLRGKVQYEMGPNHGSSLRDAINRIEESQKQAMKTVRGMSRDIGRLADADQNIQEIADHAHESLNKRIERVENNIFTNYLKDGE